jgi:3-deoxy-D-manno-octulosonic-acid transferase
MSFPQCTFYSAAAGLVLEVYWLFRYGHGHRQDWGSALAVPNNFNLASLDLIHAVSVGEVLAVRLVLAPATGSHHRFGFPTTDTGQKSPPTASALKMSSFPLDFAFAARAGLRLGPAHRGRETEFWPNFLRVARQSGARVAIVNACISIALFPAISAGRNAEARPS